MATRDQINGVMTEYLALEHARILRRLLVTRFSLIGFALGVAGLGLHWLPPFGSWFSMALCAVAPVWAWIVELRCGWRLDRELQKVVKSS